MINEWYTGSDATLDVPRRISTLDRLFDEMSLEERCGLLEALLAVERDRNWRGYLLTRLGMNHDNAGNLAEAARIFEEALTEFRPYDRTFLDVIEAYCRAIDGFIRRSCSDTHRVDRQAVAALSALAFVDLAPLTRDEWVSILGWGARGLTALGYRSGERLFHEIALAVALKAHHLDSEQPGVLTTLLYCYFNLGNPEMCERVYNDYLGIAEPGELREDTVKFMKDRFAEISGGRTLPLLDPS